MIAQIQTFGRARDRLRADEAMLHARQLALGHLRVVAQERLRDDEAEHGIADELESLVVQKARAHFLAGADALVGPGAVRQGAREQRAVLNSCRSALSSA
jgi:hypothetical protein